MKPAAIAATVLLHTAAVGTFYHYSTTEPNPRTGDTIYSVALLQGNAAHNTSADQRPPPDAPLSPSHTAAMASNASAAQSGQTSFTGITGVSIPADYAGTNQKPVYPLLSRKLAEQGTVVLRIQVKEDGSPGDVRIQQSSGYPLLDESALSAVRQWRFHPASINHRPVTEWYQIAIPFKLQNNLQK